jgi:ribosomal protein S18 acetylase RimI-like enzyme
MDDRLVELSQLTSEDLKHLAILHHSVMHTLLSDLGLPIVWRYYQIAQRDSQTIGHCIISDSGEILGWAMGSPHPDRITLRLRSRPAWFLIQMLRITLTRPVVLWQLISSVFSASAQGELKPGAIELTYIGVTAGQRGKGLGRIVLNAFIEASRKHGYRSVVLSVEKENSPAIALYEKSGFRIIKTFSEGRYQRHRMELTLT